MVMAGRAGDAGDAGDAGNFGSAIAGPFFADRVDLPFITEADKTGAEVAHQHIRRKHFGARNWDPGWAAWRVLADFALTKWDLEISLPAPEHIMKQTGRDPAAKSPEAALEAELKDLEMMALDERPDALGEIVAQANEFISYFMTVLGGRPSTHPASCLVFNSANLVATMVVMHFKGIHDRPRPSQVFPALLPPIEVPGHASYPSGHATQAHLFAHCAKEMLTPLQPEGAAAVHPEGEKVETPERIGVVLNTLARRIARNREIAGLHYASDSAAGEHLATKIFNSLRRIDKFKAAMDLARSEWQEGRAPIIPRVL
jgi:hypothetical protein